MEASNVKVLELSTLEGIGVALLIGGIASVGLIIRGMFMYYIKYKAPNDRPINKTRKAKAASGRFSFEQGYNQRCQWY